MNAPDAKEEPERKLLAAAARIFGVDAASLSLDSRYGDTPGWDSVNHIRLVMEAEEILGAHYPLPMIPRLTRLGDFLCN